MLLKPLARRYLLDERRPMLRWVGRQMIRVRRRMNRINDHHRPQYRDCVVAGAKLAVALGHKRMTVVEFGVATGHGLIALERISTEVERMWPITIDVVGFDLGRGLPPPSDYRDLPWHWRAGDFPMDENALRKRIDGSALILGDLAETLPPFIERGSDLRNAPIGAVMFDLDFYSSTAVALQILEREAETHLPRIQTYFDDLGRTNEFIGEWLAIKEFNARHTDRKLSFRFDRIGDSENRQILEFHHFTHPYYSYNPRQSRRRIL